MPNTIGQLSLELYFLAALPHGQVHLYPGNEKGPPVWRALEGENFS